MVWRIQSNLVSLCRTQSAFDSACYCPCSFSGIINSSAGSTCLDFLFSGGRRASWEVNSSWGSGALALGKLVSRPDTCVLRGRGRWWERVRNFLGGKDLSTWNVTQNKVLVIRAKRGSSEYNASALQCGLNSIWTLLVLSFSRTSNYLLTYSVELCGFIKSSFKSMKVK